MNETVLAFMSAIAIYGLTFLAVPLPGRDTSDEAANPVTEVSENEPAEYLRDPDAADSVDPSRIG